MNLKLTVKNVETEKLMQKRRDMKITLGKGKIDLAALTMNVRKFIYKSNSDFMHQLKKNVVEKPLGE